MEDSFFGFDTSAPVEDDGGGFKDGSEDEYDALNDETFGGAIKGDWENIHENLVRLDGLNGSKDERDIDENSDLEINLSRVKLDDVDVGSDDNEGRIQLDPSVWANTLKPETHHQRQNMQTQLYSNPEAFLRQHFSNPFENISQSPQQQQQPNRFYGLSDSNVPRQICTVEDIERNIRNQQQLRASTPRTKSSTPTLLPQQQQIISQQPLTNGHFFNRTTAPPGFIAPRPNFNMHPHHLNMHPGSHPQHRMPPGFPALPVIPGHSISGQQHHTNFPRPMPHNLPIALNNFAMHPNFNAMRPVGTQMPPTRLSPHPAMMNQAFPNSVNQFNQRLVQEIQQNHPMLTNARSINHVYSANLCNQMQNQNHQPLQRHNGKQNMRPNGNMLEEYDEYSNLMSTRDKHWLIAIQIAQLNTSTPYVDDYYYTVFKERKEKLNGNCQSKAHKDNQLNHPLTQPKGHAQLVLISMGKNGTNVRNGQNKERKNSETKNDKDQSQRTYTPLQFENSLGKLQYGSVTAPRKIIDMDVMGTDGNSQFNTSIELSTQRKSRQLLLHIETLYRIILKLEDLENPAAIATSLILKEKKEKESLAQVLLDATNNTVKTVDKLESTNNSINSSLSDKFSDESESKDKLMQKLISGLTTDKVMGMMNVRKGKTLIRRIIPHITDNPILWTLWTSVFSSLQSVLKKDKDDIDGVLFALYPEFKKNITNADFEEVVKIANAMPLNDKKFNILFTSKFCISSLVVILLRAEKIYSTSKVDSLKNKEWSQFLSLLATSLSRTIQQQTISAIVESDAIQPMVNHFSRFKDLQLDPLLALFSQAKQQLSNSSI